MTSFWNTIFSTLNPVLETSTRRRGQTSKMHCWLWVSLDGPSHPAGTPYHRFHGDTTGGPPQKMDKSVGWPQ